MESLNISKLNLSSVRSHTSEETAAKTEMTETKPDNNSYPEFEDDFHCEYKEEIWQSLLEQEAEKHTIHLQSPQLEFRGSLVRQLRDVSKKLGLSISTLHSAVSLLDLFMDAHRLRADRLAHVALACLSLAGKSEEKFSRAPSLKSLSRASGTVLCGGTFRQLEWMVGQHARWRLLAPTPATFASLLSQYVVMDSDLTTRHPKFVRRFKRDGAKMLEAYLDLTLSDVRLAVVEGALVGGACVWCARQALGLAAWPADLARAAQLQPARLQPLASLLHRMMQIVKSKSTPELEDQGYGSAKTTPNQTPTTSPNLHITDPNIHITDPNLRVVDLSNGNYLDRNLTNISQLPLYRLPVDMTMQRVDYYRNRLCDTEASTSVAVKRPRDTNSEIERKRYRLASQMSQVVL